MRAAPGAINTSETVNTVKGAPNGNGAPEQSSRKASDLEAPAMDLSQLGSVRIARRVLRTVVEQAALGVPGVAHMASVTNRWPQLLGRPLPRHGVGLILRGDQVTLDLYLIVQAGVNMVEVGSQTQAAVGAAIEHILGMGVSAINVYIQDVA
ncbi:MAG: Asp23/Gls24 family envelope stress response protein [Ktedonobacterales bacterium]